MAEDNWLNRDWKDRSFIDKASVVASGGTGMLAREGFKMWQGDTNRLDDIKAQAAELENSPYTTATVTQQNQDYYSKVMADYAKAKREAEFGFTPEQTAAAKQTFAETTNLGAQNAMNAGGGTIAKYINANLNSNQNKFATGLAEADANLKMQKQQQVLNYLSQVGNASGISQDVFTQNFNKNILAEQAIGAAERDWYTQRDTNRRDLINAGASVVGQGASIAAGMPV
jgi:hypothetical protein